MPSRTAREQRAQDHAFVLRCNLDALRARGLLPLKWPTPPDLPPSPKRRYRSHYVYLGWDDLYDPQVWASLSPFELSLRLVDYSPLRDLLAQRLGWTSARGHVPFDPVSQFLLFGWQNETHWNRATLLAQLHKPGHADDARRFGFVPGQFPTEGGVRYFLTTLGAHSEEEGDTVTVGEGDVRETFPVQRLNELLLPAMALVLQSGVMSLPVWSEALIGLDGMLRPAASHMQCYAVTASCYQPVTPGATPPRACPAKDEAKPEERDRRGCDCRTWACQAVCQYATPRDAQARFVIYTGSNAHAATAAPAPPHAGTKVYGYRELAITLVDPERRCRYPVLCDFRPANDGECAPMAALLAQLLPTYAAQPGLLDVALHVATTVGDSAFGQEPALSVLYYGLHTRRVLDLRASQTDKNQLAWPARGYDDKGRPLCEFGYGLTANGFDAERQRHKWFCGKACQHGVEPLVRVPDTQYPPPECPWQGAPFPQGRLLNVGFCFGDGSSRLVRDLVPGTPAWKACYAVARNASEGHNAGVQQHGQKRLPVFGQVRGKALTFLHNVWEILTTLARLVYEATQAARALPLQEPAVSRP